MVETKPKSSLASLVARPLLAGAVAAGAAAPLSATADIFLKLDGIPGESTNEKFKGEIEILSYTQSFRNSVTIGTGSTGKPTCGAVTVLKNIDKSSPNLIGAVLQGSAISKGTISFVNVSAGGSQAPYYTVTMTNLFVTAIDQTDQPDPSRIVERVTLQPSKFEFEYRPQDDKGGLGATEKFSFDCRTNSKL